MDVSFLCVLIAGILPYVYVGYCKFGAGGYDNRRPREFLEKLEGRPKRAYHAQLNAFEAFPFFAAAVIIAHLTPMPQWQITLFSVLFIIFRIAHGVLYILDMPLYRSLAWFGGILCVLTLFLLALI